MRPPRHFAVKDILFELFSASLQCAAADGQTRYGFAGPLLSLLGFVWWAAYGAAATSAANTGNQLDPSLTSYRTGEAGQGLLVAPWSSWYPGLDVVAFRLQPSLVANWWL